jgi:quercetin dioxygenase-like cupin family protein
MVPKIVRRDEAHTISLYDVVFRYGIGSHESDGNLAMLEVSIPPRTLVKPHMHTLEDEFSLILSGTVGARLGEETVAEIPTGSWLVKPRLVPHAMWNVTDEPVRILEVVLPGGIERYFEQIAPVLREHGRAKRYNALANEYGLTILDDWSDELQRRYGITL